jgi:dTDP-4-amino-4,6-dideoxygalactose transaminase
LGVSIANAVALWGGVPVFVDIRPDTLNFDEELVEQAITPRTKAILPIHYAGVPAEMDQLNEIATRNSLFVVKDAAQAIGSKYEGRQAGSLGHLAAFSFQETKNIISGEGGALAINDPALIARTEIMREKGTDRKNFIRGQVDKYTRVDLGWSFLRGEPVAAFLFGKLEQFAAIQSDRGRTGKPMTRHCSRSIIAVCGHPSSHPIATPISHIYYIILPDPDCRQDLRMKTEGIQHAVPLCSLAQCSRGPASGTHVGPVCLKRKTSARVWCGCPLYPHGRRTAPRGGRLQTHLDELL